jgi:acyl carrier protein phosphodiesterase
MDHLAHVVLAGRNPLAVTGALLGDFWRGALDPAWPAALAAGVRLHRRIDTWTDHHPAVAEVRASFDRGFRRYAGIALDVWFDHLLANDFERRAGEPLPVVEDRVRVSLARAPTDLPMPFRVHAARVLGGPGLGAIARREVVDATLMRIGARLSRPNPLPHALPLLEAMAPPLERAFARLWPELAAEAARFRVEAGLDG